VLLPLLIVLTAVALGAPYVSSGPAPLVVSGAAALSAVMVGFTLVWRSRAGPRALIAAVLILVNLVLVLRVLVTPR
jgi:hypothetical protein